MLTYSDKNFKIAKIYTYDLSMYKNIKFICCLLRGNPTTFVDRWLNIVLVDKIMKFLT